MADFLVQFKKISQIEHIQKSQSCNHANNEHELLVKINLSINK